LLYIAIYDYILCIYCYKWLCIAIYNYILRVYCYIWLYTLYILLYITIYVCLNCRNGRHFEKKFFWYVVEDSERINFAHESRSIRAHHEALALFKIAIYFVYMTIYFIYNPIYDYIWLYTSYLLLYIAIHDYILCMYYYIWLYMTICFVYIAIYDYILCIYCYIWLYIAIYNYILRVYCYIWLYALYILLYITIYVCLSCQYGRHFEEIFFWYVVEDSEWNNFAHESRSIRAHHEALALFKSHFWQLRAIFCYSFVSSHPNVLKNFFFDANIERALINICECV